jgi:hypothetical protein
MAVASLSHSVASRDAEAVLVGQVQRLRACRRPVDRPVAAAREGALQVTHDLLHHRRVDAQSAQLLELGGVDAALPAHEIAQELGEVLGFGAVVVGHVGRLSAGR